MDETAIRAKGLEIVDEFTWDSIETLRSGTDFRNGITYLTVPMRINRLVKATKKGDHDKIVTEDGTLCITSERETFAFTPERVADFGFEFPATFMRSKEDRWSKASMKTFLDGSAAKVNPVAIYNALVKCYKDYIEFADEAYYTLMPLFIMGSYHFRLFDAIGYIHFNGTAASGKSQNLRIITAMAFNPQWSSNISTAALFRSIAGNPGVVCLDEAEGFDGERGEEVRRLLNAGYLDGSTAKRIEKDGSDRFVMQDYEVYGPKAIASINPLEQVIASRCIVVAMRPALRNIPDFQSKGERWSLIRDRLYHWMMTSQPAIKELVDEWNEITRFERAKNLKNREWQITQSYIVIADYLDKMDKGKRVEQLVTFFETYFTDKKKNSEATDRIRLTLKALPRVLQLHHPHDGHYYPLKNIHEVISAYIEDDSKDYFKTRTVGKYLDVLGFKQRRAHKQGSQVWIEADKVRQELNQRQVEPFPEDIQWLTGAVEYELQDAGEVIEPMKASTSVWDNLEDDESWR